MNYSSVRLIAVVDWADIEIHTTKPTDYEAVRKAWKAALCLPNNAKPYIEPQNETSSGTATAFNVRIHDVKRYQDIVKTVLQVRENFGIEPYFNIVRIEIALDAFCNNAAEQAARFYKFLTQPVSDNRRVYHQNTGSVKAVPYNFESLTDHLRDGYQIGIGNKDDDLYQHAYFKTSDTLYGVRREVEPRARFETRFGGAKLPCETPDEWERFRFESMSHLFNWRKDKDHITDQDIERDIADAMTLDGVRRSGSRLMVADSELNEKARNVLRELSDRWQSTARRGRPAKVSACKNSGGINAQLLESNGFDLPRPNNYYRGEDANAIETEEDNDKDTQEDIQKIPDAITTTTPNAASQHRPVMKVKREDNDTLDPSPPDIDLPDLTPEANAELELERLGRLFDD